MQINWVFNKITAINPIILKKYSLHTDNPDTLEHLLQKTTTDLLAKYFFCFPAKSKVCFFDLQVGNGGQDSENWTMMLFNMYQSYWNKNSIKYNIVDCDKTSAGLKSVKIQVQTCWTKWMGEHGIHRLVRKSPFNAKNKRQTSFVSVRIYPLISQSKQTISSKELRIDTYNASGAGGQHVNKTESAIRITHLPSKIVVQCQQFRSQHQNKSAALDLLYGKLLDLEQQKHQGIYNQNKTNINFGQQTRSYTLDPKTIINDHQLQIKKKNNKILLGDLDEFLDQASIKLFLHHACNTPFFINNLKQIT